MLIGNLKSGAAMADSSCGELSESVQRNAKPVHEVIPTQRMAYMRRRIKPRFQTSSYFNRRAHTLVCLRKASEDSVCYFSARFVQVAGSFARAQDDKRVGLF